MIEQLRRETASQRMSRFDARLAKLRQEGLAYVLLCSDGVARASRPGKLRLILQHIAQRDPVAQLIELADPEARKQILKWALQSRPVNTKGSN